MKEIPLGIACPGCDYPVSDFLFEDMNAHLAACNAVWVQVGKRWGTINAERPKVIYCHACGQFHKGKRNAFCGEGTLL